MSRLPNDGTDGDIGAKGDGRTLAVANVGIYRQHTTVGISQGKQTPSWVHEIVNP